LILKRSKYGILIVAISFPIAMDESFQKADLLSSLQQSALALRTISGKSVSSVIPSAQFEIRRRTKALRDDTSLHHRLQGALELCQKISTDSMNKLKRDADKIWTHGHRIVHAGHPSADKHSTAQPNHQTIINLQAHDIFSVSDTANCQGVIGITQGKRMSGYVLHQGIPIRIAPEKFMDQVEIMTEQILELSAGITFPEGSPVLLVSSYRIDAKIFLETAVKKIMERFDRHEIKILFVERGMIADMIGTIDGIAIASRNWREEKEQDLILSWKELRSYLGIKPYDFVSKARLQEWQA